jgi:hypothetical protein
MLHQMSSSSFPPTAGALLCPRTLLRSNFNSPSPSDYTFCPSLLLCNYMDGRISRRRRRTFSISAPSFLLNQHLEQLFPFRVLMPILVDQSIDRDGPHSNLKAAVIHPPLPSLLSVIRTPIDPLLLHTMHQIHVHSSSRLLPILSHA